MMEVMETSEELDDAKTQEQAGLRLDWGGGGLVGLGFRV